MKIKLKDNYKYSSVSNKYFTIRKGQTINVADAFEADSTVFEVIEAGKPLPVRKMSDAQLKKILEDKVEKIELKIREVDMTFQDMVALLNFERTGQRRRNILNAIQTLFPDADIMREEEKKSQEERKIVVNEALKRVKRVVDEKDASMFLDQNSQTVLKSLSEKDLSQADLSILFTSENKGKKRKSIIDRIKELMK